MIRSVRVLGFLFGLPAGAGIPVWTTNGPGPSPLKILSLAVHPSANGTIYAGSNLTFPVHAAIFKSGDSGKTWLRVFEDSSELEGITAIAVDPSDPQVVYAGTGFCHFRLGCHGRLLRSGDEGSSWVQVSSPGYVTAVAVDPNPPHALYTNAAQSFPMGPTVSLETNTGLQSFDGGRSWTNIPGRFPPVRIAEFLFDAAKPGTILVGSPEGISRSVDGGQTWNAISNGLRNLAVRAVCLGNDSAFYAATSDGVYKSSDQGAFWSATDFAFPAVAIVSNRHGLFVASPGTGVYESRDAGATWTATNEGLTDLSVRTLVFEPQGTLHAGTDSGVFDLSLRNLPRVVGER